MPNNLIKRVWDLYVILLLLYTAICVPFIVCFNISRDDGFNFVFDLVVDASFLIDIILTFFTALQFHDQYVVDRPTIAKDYVKGWFVIDILTTIPFQLLG
jgi:hypothetical protein